MMTIIAATSRDARMVQWTTALFLGIILLLIFVVAAVAIVHFSRRYRQFLLRQKSSPTPSDDVWEMHQVPVDADDTPSPES
jgi:hypothetical protein